jgi:hypothetical protein
MLARSGRVLSVSVSDIHRALPLPCTLTSSRTDFIEQVVAEPDALGLLEVLRPLHDKNGKSKRKVAAKNVRWRFVPGADQSTGYHKYFSIDAKTLWEVLKVKADVRFLARVVIYALS